MSGCAQSRPGRAGEVKTPFEMPGKHPDHSVIHYADYAICNTETTYINSALIVETMTLVILSVLMIEIENNSKEFLCVTQ